MRLYRMVVCVVLACAAWPALPRRAQGPRRRRARRDLRHRSRRRAARARRQRPPARARRTRPAVRGRGRDRLYGGDGGDVLRGGPDGDRLVGGGGARPAARRHRRRHDQGARRAARPHRRAGRAATARRSTHGRDPRRDRREPAGKVRGGASAAGRKPDAFMVAAGDIARCPGAERRSPRRWSTRLPGTIAAARRHRVRERHAGRVRELLRADVGPPQGAHAPGRRQPRVRDARRERLLRLLRRRRRRPRARASTPTRSAPGTSWR